MKTLLNSSLPVVHLVIPCAGVGKRMQAAMPKQYLMLGEQTVVEATLQAFVERIEIKTIVLVVAEGDQRAQALDLVKRYPEKIHFTLGGQERSDSVAKGLAYLQDKQLINPSDLVAVHDAARPCVSQADLDAVFKAASQSSAGALLALQSFNTLKRAENTEGNVESNHASALCSVETLDRSLVYQALTPQVFPYETLNNALRRVRKEGLVITDDASAVELCGLKPRLVLGDARNIKITEQGDLSLAAFFLEQMRQES